MIKILFVCHGNICRSPMAEFVFQNLVEKQGLDGHFVIRSAATSTEEIGNPVHPGTCRKLRECGVPVGEHRAVQMCRADVENYDYLLGMDSRNIANMRRIANMRCIEAGDSPKIRRLLDFSTRPRDIADPWYTGNFDETYADVLEGCQALLQELMQNGLLGK